MRRVDRLAKLEKACIPAEDMNLPVLMVSAGESDEEAAARQGIDLSDPRLLKVLFVIPDNGRDRQ
jgi:hypothetical protein